MPWEELQIDVARQHLEALSGRLFELGCSGLQEDHLPGQAPAPRQPWDNGPFPPPTERLLIKAWFENPDHLSISAHIADLPGWTDLRWEMVPDTDWENDWKKHFPILRISDRLVIAPPWENQEGAVIIEPGQGFGSGQHPTTLAALVAIDAILTLGECKDLLDIGSGSGILAISAAFLGFEAKGIDIDPVAVTDAKRNAERNGFDIDFSTTPIPKAIPADLVVANLHAELLNFFADDLVRLSKKWLVVAGILADCESLAREKVGSHFTLMERHQEGEWVSLRYRKEPVLSS